MANDWMVRDILAAKRRKQIALVPRERMTCEEFYESRAEREIDEVVQESYWDGGCDTELMFKVLCRLANESGVTLTDADAWAYDDYFYNVYQCAEKGLS